MKVLLLTDQMDMGGAETHVAQLARGLKAAGVEVTLLSGGGRLAKALEEEGIPQKYVSLPTHNLFRLRAIRKQLRRLVWEEDFEILHAHARIPALLLRGCEAWKTQSGKHPVPIVTAHARFAPKGIFRHFCYWGKVTVAVSEDIRAHLCNEYHRRAESIRVIPNGIDSNLFSPSPIPKEKDRPLRVLFASRLDFDCSLGAELLCRILPALYRDFPSLRITVAGGGSELKKLRDTANTINRALNAEVLMMTGFCEDMPSLLKQQDIFIGVSRCAMEAGACGCAVILCGNEGYAGILSAKNAREAMLSNLCGRDTQLPNEALLERDLRTLLADSSLRHRLGEECRALVQSHFSADGMCRSTLALYHRHLASSADALLVIGGYFGCGNFGDDAILLGFLEALHQTAPGIRVLALTKSPHIDSKRFGIECANRKNPFSILWAFLRADLFLCGGGSLLQNLTSRRSLSYYLGLLKHARCMGCITVLYSAGIGPLIGHQARQSVQKELSQCRYISLRDPDSKQKLQALGVDRSILFDGADPALLMPLAGSGRAFSILREHGISPSQKILCVILRRIDERSILTRLIPAALRTLCKRQGLLPLFLSFDDADASCLFASAKATGGRIVKIRESADAVALFSISDLVLSMRLHALIFSAMAGTPAIGIPIDPRDQKIPSFAKQAGLDFIPPDELTVGNLVERMETAIQKAPSLRPILADSMAQMRKKARKDLANIVWMIYNRDNEN